MKLPELINTYQIYLKVEKNYSKNTIDSYISDINQFFLFKEINININSNERIKLSEDINTNKEKTKLSKERKLVFKINNQNSNKWENLLEEDAFDYIKFSRSKYKVSSHNRKLSALKKFYKYLEKTYQINDIFGNLKQAKTPKKLPNFFREAELFAFLDSIPEVTNIDIRDKAMIEVLYATGVRSSELLNIKKEDIKFEEGLVHVVGKGNKERVVPMNDTSLESCRKYLKIRINFLGKENTNYLFLNNRGKQLTRQGFDKILKSRAKVANISDISAHKLRHSLATHLLNNGGDLRMIQMILGHKQISTTEIYTHVNKRELLEEYKKYFSLGEENE